MLGCCAGHLRELCRWIKNELGWCGEQQLGCSCGISEMLLSFLSLSALPRVWAGAGLDPQRDRVCVLCIAPTGQIMSSKQPDQPALQQVLFLSYFFPCLENINVQIKGIYLEVF